MAPGEIYQLLEINPDTLCKLISAGSVLTDGLKKCLITEVSHRGENY